MRAVWYERQGPAQEVLVHGKRPDPEPGRGELRVRLQASGVNPSDTNRRRGGDAYRMEYPFVIPNSDGAGVVDRVGDAVSSEWLGRRVWLYNGQRGSRACGTAAEYIALDATLVAPLPEGVTFEEGACLGIPCMTAYHCVFLDGPVSGKTVLVTGGAGAVGNYAIQLARWGGARVIATDSGEARMEDARRAGAECVIDYRADDVAAKVLEATNGGGVDRVVDVDFGGNLPITLVVLRTNGVVVTYASRGNPRPTTPFYEMIRKNATIHFVLLPTTPPAARREAQEEIVRWLGEGRRLHRVSAVYPLSRTADAHLAVEAGGKRGTVVVDCSA